jgi:hypothetical protein
METAFKVKDLYQKSQPEVLSAVAEVISVFVRKNSYNVSSAEASVITLPNVVEADGCEFLFIAGTCTGGVTVKDDFGNSVLVLATDNTPVKIESAGAEWCQFDKDTDTHAT